MWNVVDEKKGGGGTRGRLAACSKRGLFSSLLIPTLPPDIVQQSHSRRETMRLNKQTLVALDSLRFDLKITQIGGVDHLH